MKPFIIIAIFLFVLFAKPAHGQSTSAITYDAGTTINIGAGADVCATSITINGTYSGTGTICTGALPVTMSSFTACVNLNNSILMWVTEVELNNSGFDIERATVTLSGAGEWKKIAFITGNGTTNQPKGYIFEDKKLTKGTYQYRLKQIDYNGNFEYFELAGDVIIAPPSKFTVSQNYPNPSNPKSKIDYEIPFNGKVSMVVYDMLGKEITTIVNETKEAGYYTAEFDGSNIASGVYFYRIIAEGDGKENIKTMKMVLVK